MNWRGRPLASHEVVLNTIAATTTTTGLKVQAVLDSGSYPTGIAVSREQLAALPITAHSVHGRWNYSITPAAIPADTPRADDRAQARAQTQAMLADPRLTGMSSHAFERCAHGSPRRRRPGPSNTATSCAAAGASPPPAAAAPCSPTPTRS